MHKASTLFLLFLLPFMACKKQNTFKKYKPYSVDFSPSGYYGSNPQWPYKALQVVLTQGSNTYYSKVYRKPDNDPYNYSVRMEDSVSALFQPGIVTVSVYEQGKKLGEAKGDFAFNNPYFYAGMDSFSVNVSLIEQR